MAKISFDDAQKIASTNQFSDIKYFGLKNDGDEALVRIMGPKASAVLVNAFRSGTNIYGAAAMKSAAKLLRGNAITGVVSFVVLSVGDVELLFYTMLVQVGL